MKHLKVKFLLILLNTVYACLDEQPPEATYAYAGTGAVAGQSLAAEVLVGPGRCWGSRGRQWPSPAS